MRLKNMRRKPNLNKMNGSYCVIRHYDGLLRIKAEGLYNGQDGKLKAFMNKVFDIQGVNSVKTSPVTRTILIHYDSAVLKKESILKKIMNGRSKRKSEHNIVGILEHLENKGKKVTERLEINRYGKIVTTWHIEKELPGRLRLRNPFLLQNKHLCQQLSNVLLNVSEIKKFKVSHITGSVLIVYDQNLLNREKFYDLLDTSTLDFLEKCELQENKPDNFVISTFTLGSLMLSQAYMPLMIPLITLLICYGAQNSFKKAFDAIFKDKKIKVDILDSIVISLCLVSGQLVPAALMVWILDFADKILNSTSEQSKKLLTQIFGKQASQAWLIKRKTEVKIPVEKLKIGDIISVHTGEHIPVDGVIVGGEAMIDQHTLTGESAPVEKRIDDEVFSSTVVLAGKIFVKVRETGDNTNASKIIKIINQAAEYKLKVSSAGEKIADRMVIPTLGLATIGFVTAGQNASLAIINSDYGTGIRVAAPMAVLSSLANAAKHGILMKNGQVLESILNLDAILFDKTGTLTNEVPEVTRIICCNKFNEEKVLLYAAAAEQRFSHPIAAAILAKAAEKGLSLPKRDDSKYHVGFGIQVVINGDLVKVGSARYMGREGVTLSGAIQSELDRIGVKGYPSVLVSINDKLAGIVELRASARFEAFDVINKIKGRGIKEIILISGDHEAPTKHLAEKLGIDRYFSGVLPHEKAEYVKLLQREGKKVGMVGDGINDSVALSFADVSISLRGASSIATDVADIVFMDGDLKKFDYLFEIAESLQRNVQRSLLMIAIPNSLCIAGAMFGLVGLSTSLILNNGFNFAATINGLIPFFNVVEQRNTNVASSQII